MRLGLQFDVDRYQMRAIQIFQKPEDDGGFSDIGLAQESQVLPIPFDKRINALCERIENIVSPAKIRTADRRS